MIELPISKIDKDPSLMTEAEDAVLLIRDGSKSPIGIFIPSHIHSLYDQVLKELDYQEFLQRNKEFQRFEDDTLEDGLNI